MLNNNKRNERIVAIKLAVCIVLGFLGVIYAIDLRLDGRSIESSAWGSMVLGLDDSQAGMPFELGFTDALPLNRSSSLTT